MSGFLPASPTPADCLEVTNGAEKKARGHDDILDRPDVSPTIILSYYEPCTYHGTFTVLASLAQLLFPTKSSL